jgi:AcrR family transcriptional regulator
MPNLQRPPGTRTGAARRRALSLDAMVEVALSIVDTEGIDAVSMRRVAAHFQTGPASLYAYVANRDELLQHVLLRVIDEMTIVEKDTWQETLRAWVLAGREVMIRHADVARLTFGTVPVTDRVVESIEVLLRQMIQGGVPPQVATWALDITSLFLGADVYEGWLMQQRFTDGSGRDAEEVGQEYFQQVAAGFAALPPERFPYLVDNLDLMMSGGGDDRFTFGLDLLIAGISAQVR